VRDEDADANNNKKCRNSFKHGCFQAMARVRGRHLAQSKRFNSASVVLLLFCCLVILGNGSPGGPEMITLRLAVPSVLVAAAVAGCFAYLVTPPVQVKADPRSQPGAPGLTRPDTRTSTVIDPRPSLEEEKAAAAFREAAAAILRRAPNTRASAFTEEPPITGRIPLPKRRPINLP